MEVLTNSALSYLRDTGHPSIPLPPIGVEEPAPQPAAATPRPTQDGVRLLQPLSLPAVWSWITLASQRVTYADGGREDCGPTIATETVVPAQKAKKRPSSEPSLNRAKKWQEQKNTTTSPLARVEPPTPLRVEEPAPQPAAATPRPTQDRAEAASAT
ncbi:unnamed protein product [Mytilus coruscus]|uniref:Uncharacterized protein n=1 Tax=Mytilus coruscus TaxID=42192 RepID=A0A6J8EG89_MYTCO|nr:unnamed protein product [Mytilus coruscus]